MKPLPSIPALRRGSVAPVVVLALGQAEPLQGQLAQDLPLAHGGQLVGQEEAGERALEGQVGRSHGALLALS
ncbi:MAG TPA: hypothetical protein VGL31_08130 [Xanthobacteraceae bacterium]